MPDPARRGPAPRPTGGRSSASRRRGAGSAPAGPPAAPRARSGAGGLLLPADPDGATHDGAAPPSGSYTTRLATLALVLALLAVSYAYPVRAFFQQRALVADAQAERASLLVAEDDLQAQQRRWEDPAYVRAQARARLGFTMPGEVGLVVVGTEDMTAPDPQTGPVVPTLARSRQWWERLWAGVELAGTPPPDQAGSP